MIKAWRGTLTQEAYFLSGATMMTENGYITSALNVGR